MIRSLSIEKVLYKILTSVEKSILTSLTVHTKASNEHGFMEIKGRFAATSILILCTATFINFALSLYVVMPYAL